MHKLDQSELKLDRSQLPNSKHLSLVQQEAAQPNIAKKVHHKILVITKIYLIQKAYLFYWNKVLSIKFALSLCSS